MILARSADVLGTKEFQISEMRLQRSGHQAEEMKRTGARECRVSVMENDLVLVCVYMKGARGKAKA